MDVSVIVVNYNTADLLADCIDSVLCQSGVSFEIIVVDNASQDGSQSTILAYGNRIHAIFNLENVGFGKANNIAFQQSRGRYIYLLNPDAKLRTSADLQKIVKFMEEHSEYGLIGTQVAKGQSGKTALPQLYYPGQRHLSKPLQTLPGNIAWVLGASMAIRRDAYTAVDGFDENFFLYAEEADFCLRIRKLGYVIGYCSDVAIDHIGGASERRNDIEAIQWKKQQGLYLFYTKHYAAIDVIRLLKKNRRRAFTRMLLIGFKKKALGLNERQQSRFSVYKVIFQSSSEFLRKYQNS